MIEAHNLIEIRELYNLSQEDLAKNIGRTRELVNKMERGKSVISNATWKRIQTYLSTLNKVDFSQDVNFLGKASQETSRTKNHQPYYLERREQKKETISLQVPLVGIKAQAGYIKGFEHVDYMDTLDKYSLPPGVNPLGAVWSYFEVDGESMEPTLYAGDVILASMLPHEDWGDVKNFCVYILLTGDQLLVKRVFRKNDKEWVLISDNEEVAPQVLVPVSSIKQVWTFRRHIRSRVPQPKDFKIAV
jgi:phage repressor protein C with HTH and peptisase S24 domain